MTSKSLRGPNGAYQTKENKKLPTRRPSFCIIWQISRSYSTLFANLPPLIGPPLYKMTRKGQICCTTVALSGGQICKYSWITSRFCQIMQKLGLLVGNFLFSFVWCALHGSRRLFEVTEAVMSFFHKNGATALGYGYRKNVLRAFLLYFWCSTTFIYEKTGWLSSGQI